MAPGPDAYRIEFSSTSWSQLGRVPADVFKQVRRALETLATQGETAAELAAAERSGSPVLGRLRFGEYLLIYERDVLRRTLLLLSVRVAGHVGE